MQKQIISRIKKLGGQILKARDDTLRAHMSTIQFPHVLYDQDWDVYGIDAFYEKNRGAFHSTPTDFYDALEAEYFTDSDKPRGQSFWCNELFTPLTPGTDHFKEWSSCFDSSDSVDLQPIRDIVGGGRLEFVQIMYSFGFPDHYYVCLQDPKPANPTVFGTDHEVFFQEYSVVEPLSMFLKRFLTRSAFRKIVREYLSGKSG